ncbi:MAG: hypothetical protein ACTSX1_03740 [Candidatus Heimdallarchaeaceae archaeon]
MRKKVLTIDCPSCDDLHIGDNSEFICRWGKSSSVKIMEPHKGKRPRTCRLIKRKTE